MYNFNYLYVYMYVYVYHVYVYVCVYVYVYVHVHVHVCRACNSVFWLQNVDINKPLICIYRTSDREYSSTEYNGSWVLLWKIVFSTHVNILPLYILNPERK